MGIDRHDLAAKLNRTPEHVRKLECGGTFATPDLEEKLVLILQMTPKEAEAFKNAIRWDRWYEKFHEPPPQSGPSSPIDVYWDQLTNEQRQAMICIAESLARSNRAKQAE